MSPRSGRRSGFSAIERIGDTDMRKNPRVKAARISLPESLIYLVCESILSHVRVRASKLDSVAPECSNIRNASYANDTLKRMMREAANMKCVLLKLQNARPCLGRGVYDGRDMWWLANHELDSLAERIFDLEIESAAVTELSDSEGWRLKMMDRKAEIRKTTDPKGD